MNAFCNKTCWLSRLSSSSFAAFFFVQSIHGLGQLDPEKVKLFKPPAVTGNAFLDLLTTEKVLFELLVDEIQRAELCGGLREVLAARTELVAKNTERLRQPLASAGKSVPDSASVEIIQKVLQASKEFESQLADILDPVQLDRLLGIYLQQNGGMALSNSLIAERIKLSVNQRAAIGGIAVSQLTRYKIDVSSRDFVQTINEMNDKTEKLMLDVLTDEQKEEVKALMGSKFELK